MFSSTSDQEDCTLHTRADPGLQTPAAVAPLEEKVPGRAVRPRQPSAHAPHPTQAGLLHPDAQVGVERYKEHVLSYAVVTTKWSEILDHARAHRDCCPLVQVLVCDYHVALAGYFDVSAVKALNTAARIMRKYQDSPESKSAEFRCLQLYIEAFENWNRQDLEAAFRCFAEISRLDPEDLFALKRCQLLAFMRGDSRSLLGAALRVLPECQGKPFFHGMLSFALEQNGMLQLALAEGRRGVRIRESDAWSHHAVAHCLYFEGNLEGALEWLNRYKHHWEGLMPFIRTHSHWHIALCLLDQCKYDQLKETFEQELWRPEDRLCFEVQLGAAGILWKTELHALMFEHPEDSELEPSSWKAFREESADIRAWALEKMAELTHFVENAKNFVGYPLYQLLALRVLCAQEGRETAAQECFDSIREFGARDSNRTRTQIYIPLAEAIWHVYGPKKKTDGSPPPPRKGLLGAMLWEQEDGPGLYHRRPDFSAACKALSDVCHRLTDFLQTIPKKKKRTSSSHHHQAELQPHRGRSLPSAHPAHHSRDVFGAGDQQDVAEEDDGAIIPGVTPEDQDLEQIIATYLKSMETSRGFPSEPPPAHSIPSAGLAPLGGSGEQREVFLEFIWWVVLRQGMISKLEAAELARQVDGSTLNTSGGGSQPDSRPLEVVEDAEERLKCPFWQQHCRARMMDRIAQQHQQMVCFGTLRECIAHSHYAYTPAVIHLFSAGLAQLSSQYLRHSLELRKKYASSVPEKGSLQSASEK